MTKNITVFLLISLVSFKALSTVKDQRNATHYQPKCHTIKKIPAWKKKALSKSQRYRQRLEKKREEEEWVTKRNALLAILMMAIAETITMENNSTDLRRNSKGKKTDLAKNESRLNSVEKCSFDTAYYDLCANISATTIQCCNINNNKEVYCTRKNSGTGKCVSGSIDLDIAKHITLTTKEVPKLETAKNICYTKSNGNWTHLKNCLTEINGNKASLDGKSEAYYLLEYNPPFTVDIDIRHTLSDDRNSFLADIDKIYGNLGKIMQISDMVPLEAGPGKDNSWNPGSIRIDSSLARHKVIGVLAHELVHQKRLEKPAHGPFFLDVKNPIESIVGKNEEIAADLLGSLSVYFAFNKEKSLLYMADFFNDLLDVSNKEPKKLFKDVQLPYFSTVDFCGPEHGFCVTSHPNSQFRIGAIIELARQFIKLQKRLDQYVSM